MLEGFSLHIGLCLDFSAAFLVYVHVSLQAETFRMWYLFCVHLHTTRTTAYFCLLHTHCCEHKLALNSFPRHGCIHYVNCHVTMEYNLSPHVSHQWWQVIHGLSPSLTPALCLYI